MGARREGREAAVQFLFQLDLNRCEPEKLDRDFWLLRPVEHSRTPEFARSLVKGVVDHQAQIDSRIQSLATNYQLKRIAVVDRNILRVAVFEMLFSKEIPPVVVINEAIEVAKAFGSEDSGRFVNGILDRLRSDLSRPPEVRPGDQTPPGPDPKI